MSRVQGSVPADRVGILAREGSPQNAGGQIAALGRRVAPVILIKFPEQGFVLTVNNGKGLTDRSQQGTVFLGCLFVGCADFSMHGDEVRVDARIALVPIPPAPSHEEARFRSLFPYG